MKNLKQLPIALVAILCLLLFSFNATAQNVGINETGAIPDNSALLDLNSTDKGFLITRVDTANIASPAFGLMTLAPIDSCLYMYSGTKWIGLGGAGSNCSCNCASSDCTTPPTTSSAGSDQTLACGITTATLAGNAPGVGTGAWSVVSGTATITTPTSPTSGVTGLSASGGTATLQWTISNAPCAASTDVVVITTVSCSQPCEKQVWAAANLNVGTIRQSDPPGHDNQPAPYNYKFCYNNLPANCATYGGLYEWTNVMLGAASSNCDPCGTSGVQGMCPTGYHIPTDLEWSRYEYCLEDSIVPTGTTPLTDFQTGTDYRGSTTTGVGPGAKIKASSSNPVVWDGTNTSGFAALPAGSRTDAIAGTFVDLKTGAGFWSATEYTTGSGGRAYIRGLTTGTSGSGVQIQRVDYRKWRGFSIRCLKN